MTAEDLTLIEQAGRRCSSCHTGRNWRRLEVLRREGREALITCPACRPRMTEKLLSEPPPPVVEAPAAPARPRRPQRPQRASTPQREDRLKRALRELPAGTHSTARIAKAAGLNETKVLSRLRALETAGEVQQVGNQWSTERPSTDLEAAFDRLEARTGNLRIIRPGERNRKIAH
ncbi:MAG: FmdB family zinc ribbon protein [Solirubrobacteraceae bacterium]